MGRSRSQGRPPGEAVEVATLEGASLTTPPRVAAAAAPLLGVHRIFHLRNRDDDFFKYSELHLSFQQTATGHRA